MIATLGEARQKRRSDQPAPLFFPPLPGKLSRRTKTMNVKENAWANAYADFVLRIRWVIIILLVIATIAAALNIHKLDIRNDPDTLLPPSNRYVATNLYAEHNFGMGNLMVFALQGEGRRYLAALVHQQGPGDPQQARGPATLALGELHRHRGPEDQVHGHRRERPGVQAPDPDRGHQRRSRARPRSSSPSCARA